MLDVMHKVKEFYRKDLRIVFSFISMSLSYVSKCDFCCTVLNEKFNSVFVKVVLILLSTSS